MTDTVDIRCPKCNGWMGEATYYARLVCSNCGSEVRYRSKEERGLGKKRANPPQSSTKG